MPIKKFLTSVADVFAYDSNENLIFTSKTMLDTNFDVALGSTPVRGGRGSQLQYIYYHTADLKFTLTETQWNLDMLGSTAGGNFDMGNYYVSENVTVTASSGSVTKTPLAFESTLYGWATSPLGVVQRIVFTGNGFTVTGAETSGLWCIRYYTANLSSGKSLTIPSSIIPNVLKIVMETQLNSADVTTNKIGIVQIVIPRAALSGAFAITMKADGITNTPLAGNALAYTPVATSTDACNVSTYYAKITEIIDSTNWYDNVNALSISGGSFSIAKNATTTLVVYAVPTTGTSFKVGNAYLDFFSASVSASSPIGLHTGVLTAASIAGTSSVWARITSASTITTSGCITVTAV